MEKQRFETQWTCEEGHTTTASVSMLEVDIDGETYSWIGNSAWDMCNNCGDCPTDEQNQEMRDHITRQVIWHYWPEVAAEFEAIAREMREGAEA